jgi:hypothetical protein
MIRNLCNYAIMQLCDYVIMRLCDYGIMHICDYVPVRLRLQTVRAVCVAAGLATPALYVHWLRPPEQHVGARLHGEVYVRLDLVRHVGAEGAAYDTVPASLVVSVEFLPDEVGYGGVHVPGSNGESKGIARSLDCVLGPLLRHVFREDLRRGNLVAALALVKLPLLIFFLSHLCF